MEHESPVMKAWREFALADPNDCDREYDAYMALVNKMATASFSSPTTSTSSPAPAAATKASSATSVSVRPRDTALATIPTAPAASSVVLSGKDDLSPEARRIYDYLVGNSEEPAWSTSPPAPSSSGILDSGAAAATPKRGLHSVTPPTCSIVCLGTETSVMPTPSFSTVATDVSTNCGVPSKLDAIQDAVDAVNTDLTAPAPTICSSECPSRDASTSVSVIIPSRTSKSSTTICDFVPKISTPAVSAKALDMDVKDENAPTATICLPNGPDHNTGSEDTMFMPLTPWTALLAPLEESPSPQHAPIAVLEMFTLSPSTCSKKCSGCSIDTKSSLCPGPYTTPSCLLPVVTPVLDYAELGVPSSLIAISACPADPCADDMNTKDMFLTAPGPTEVSTFLIAADARPALLTLQMSTEYPLDTERHWRCVSLLQPKPPWSRPAPTDSNNELMGDLRTVSESIHRSSNSLVLDMIGLAAWYMSCTIFRPEAYFQSWVLSSSAWHIIQYGSEQSRQILEYNELTGQYYSNKGIPSHRVSTSFIWILARLQLPPLFPGDMCVNLQTSNAVTGCHSSALIVRLVPIHLELEQLTWKVHTTLNEPPRNLPRLPHVLLIVLELCTWSPCSTDCSCHGTETSSRLLTEAYKEFNTGSIVSTIAPWPPPSCTCAGTSLIYGRELCCNAQQKRGMEFSIEPTQLWEVNNMLSRWTGIYFPTELIVLEHGLIVWDPGAVLVQHFFSPTKAQALFWPSKCVLLLQPKPAWSYTCACSFIVVVESLHIISVCLEFNQLGLAPSHGSRTYGCVDFERKFTGQQLIWLLGLYSTCDQFVTNATYFGSHLFEWHIPWSFCPSRAISLNSWLWRQPVGCCCKFYEAFLFSWDVTSTIDIVPAVKYIPGIFNTALQYLEVGDYFAAAMLLTSSPLSPVWVMYLPVTCMIQCGFDLMPCEIANSRDGTLTDTARVLISWDPGGSVHVLDATTCGNGNRTQLPFLHFTWDPGGYTEHRLGDKPILRGEDCQRPVYSSYPMGRHLGPWPSRELDAEQARKQYIQAEQPH